ncbi:MAG: hypothetical protein V1921_07440 [Candidatus Altiarchaeota archaeon]
MAEDVGTRIVKEVVQIGILLFIIRWLYGVLRVELLVLKGRKQRGKKK